MNRKWVLFLIGIGLAIVAVICYSPGLVALSLTSASIVKKVLAVLVAIALVGVYVFFVLRYLKAPKTEPVSAKEVKSLKDLEKVLSEYTAGKHFGKIAQTVMEQLKRLQSSSTRVKKAVDKKFEANSLSWKKYYGIIDTAEKTAIDNIATTANRLTFFDEDEYDRLADYRNDNIPDDIQEKQIALYKENQCKIEEGIAVNENLILKLDSLALELSKITDDNEKETDSTLDEIEELTKQLKFYANK